MPTWMKALTGAMAMTAVLGACGPAEDDADTDDTTTVEDALSTRAVTYVSLRRDQRRCMAPLCGGYFATDVVNGGKEAYVSGLDFSQANLGDDAEGDVVEAADGEVIVQGKLGPAAAHYGTHALVVLAAWRGMPGKPVAHGDKVWFAAARSPQIQCLAAPCPNLAAHQPNRTATTYFSELDLAGALPGFTAKDWLENRVLLHDALVAAHWTTGPRQAAGKPKVLAASQVFVKLPEREGPCPAMRLAACPAGQVWSYTRSADRCVLPETCVPQHPCTYMLPHCPDGYTQVTWSHNSCPAFACDPTWSVPDEQ